MGGNMARRLLRGGHRVVGWARSKKSIDEIVAEGAIGATGVQDLVGRLEAPRVVWLMVPAGSATEETLEAVAECLSRGDICVDGGNSNYKETMRRAAWMRERGLRFVDCGTSGGIWGLKEGYSLMIGGEPDAVGHLRPLFETLAPASDRGWGHVGPSGAGHFVKMVHNGIEYGMMQAFAEGFALMSKKSELSLDLARIAEIWRHGSVVRSWLLDLCAEALHEDAKLEGIAPHVQDSGEGRWTVAEAIDLDVPAPVITLSLLARLRSRDPGSFADRLLASMRNKFGGHAVKASG
jgi:6-phosphogluconate dehydrogenase